MRRTRSISKKLKCLIKEFRTLCEDGFAGTGVGGVAGIGVAVNGDKTQAEPGVKKNKKIVLSTIRRKLPN